MIKAVETNPDPEAKARLIESIVAEHGSLEAFVQSMREYRELHLRLIRETPSLKEQYPDQWVGMGPGDVLVVGDSLEEVLAQLDDKGVRRDSVIEFLNTNPMQMIL